MSVYQGVCGQHPIARVFSASFRIRGPTCQAEQVAYALAALACSFYSSLYWASAKVTPMKLIKSDAVICDPWPILEMLCANGFCICFHMIQWSTGWAKPFDSTLKDITVPLPWVLPEPARRVVRWHSLQGTWFLISHQLKEHKIVWNVERERTSWA